MRIQRFKEYKQTLREFMRNHYTDEKLAALLAHARDGKLTYNCCCCFIGIATATHALRGEGTNWPSDPLHYVAATELIDGNRADHAYCYLAPRPYESNRENSNVIRRRIPIPMIKAEMRRREQLRQQAEWKQELVEMST